ncbi:hypothetical protein [Streptomyces caniscabiei]|uniref:hypothetical protein n=1 Tax=Streptomyces caniscabiei TaxID=2746961 RepID=UPI001872799D|nr:hypothetical protein [Streptomyces caniscabiei]MBE4761812.1 hypothetical protein [Streptomyces caniscabiei]MDX2947931.1 hypothetical protein [Streptomyces caniscabiei]
MTSKAAQFAAAYAVLTASHEVADYWVQQDRDAVAKGGHGHEGRVACARHVASYTATQAVALACADRGLGLGLGWKRIAGALAVSAATHYVADRSGGRWREEGPSTRLVRFARRTGHSGWLERDPGAGPLLDQAWHRGWIAIAAAVAAGGGR